MLGKKTIGITATAAAAGLIVLAALAVGQGAAAAVTPARSQAASTISVVLSEWKVVPSLTSVRAGKVTFRVRNNGAIEHEFVVLRTEARHHALPVKGGTAVEKGLKGELTTISPGQERRLTLNLKPGKYVLICNLLGHYKAGQHAALRVR